MLLEHYLNVLAGKVMKPTYQYAGVNVYVTSMPEAVGARTSGGSIAVNSTILDKFSDMEIRSFLLHEKTHIEQQERLGVLKFYLEYSKDPVKLELEAYWKGFSLIRDNPRGDAVLGYLAAQSLYGTSYSKEELTDIMATIK